MHSCVVRAVPRGVHAARVLSAGPLGVVHSSAPSGVRMNVVGASPTCSLHVAAVWQPTDRARPMNRPFTGVGNVAVTRSHVKPIVGTPLRNLSAVQSFVPATPELTGKCKCGSVEWTAKGSSTLNAICHCSICRKASGAGSITACGFKNNQITWKGKDRTKSITPENSRNTRVYCGDCDTYLAEDARTPLGVWMMPHSAVNGQVADCFQPNHHIFYADRVTDAEDKLPKWETLPQGNHIPSAPTDDSSVSTSYSPVSGRYRKDVLPLSPTRAPEPAHYHFTQVDPTPNHISKITPEKVAERTARKYEAPTGTYVAPPEKEYDVIIIGGGHNGLVSAAYLAKAGKKVLVLERRHTTGGAAVTEEMVPGFKFSRGSYLAGLFRPDIIKDLELDKHGFKYLPRNPSSFTPSLLNGPLQGKSLILGDDADANHRSISQFSAKDADNFEKYEDFLGSVRDIMDPLLDNPPPETHEASMQDVLAHSKFGLQLGKQVYRHKDILVPFYELFTASASYILDRWFESEMLKVTLATDAVIGAMVSPYHAGSAYVLLHHVMGEAAGKKGVWSYVEGGMGAISNSIAAVAQKAGTTIATDAQVKRILYSKNGSKFRAHGVEMADGTSVHGKAILSNATPYHTFLELLPGLARDSGVPEDSPLPEDFVHHIRYTDYSCGAFKINMAVDKLPNFECMPSDPSGKPGPQHCGTVHFENRLEEVDNAWREASVGMPATRPVLEMTIPSAYDTTISPPGQHVVQLFAQFAPYDVDPKIGNWADENFKQSFVDRCLGIVDEFCPGFSSSVLGVDALSPLDLERVFGLQKGNIMHGALTLNQLYMARPAPRFAGHRTPLQGLYLCGAGAHPGGGVMGAAGRNCANVVMRDM